MVPKRSKTPGSGLPGTTGGRRSRTSSNVTSPPRPSSEPVGTVEADPSNNAPATTADTTPRALRAADVTEAIEHERAELLQIQAILKCLYEVLLYADDDDSVMHADVAQVCARMVHESVRRLGELLTQGSARDPRCSSEA